MTASLELEDVDENSLPQTNKKYHKSSLCVGCGGAITDKFILRVQPDMEWHARCLRCVKCNRGLHDNNTCFVKDGKTYCKEDYQRLFQQECAACHRSLNKTDYVVHVAATRTYHMSCLKCVVCQRTLQTGDEFAIRPHGLLCLQDYQRDNSNSALCLLEEDHNNNNKLNQLDLAALSPNQKAIIKLEPTNNNSSNNNNLTTATANLTTLTSEADPLDIVLRKASNIASNCCRSYLDSINDDTNNLNMTNNSLSRAASRMSFVKGIMDDSPMNSDLDDVSQDGSSLCGNQSLTGGHGGAGSLPSTGSGVGMKMSGNGNIGTGGSSSGGGNKRSSKEQKTTRVRTVLNEKQLHTLRTCYAANPRPDALMKEQLVEMTGLSPRVIRVWFQNKRCKDKKRQIMVKQMDQHQQVSGLDCPLQGVPLVAGSPLRNDPVGLAGVGSNNPLDIQQIPGPWTTSSEHLHLACTANSVLSQNPSSSSTSSDNNNNTNSTPAFQQLISAYHHHLSRPHPPPPPPHHQQHPHPSHNISLLSAMGLLSSQPGPLSSIRNHLELDESPPPPPPPSTDSYSNKILQYNIGE